ncbi:MAG TPA: hypothetical protein VMR41_01030 [Patescibacteria group bacterium]|nr:hypothetical protein [Patescibacteria group bacterium]
MLRTNVYLTQKQEQAIKLRAAVSKQPRAVVLRAVIDEGLKAIPVQASSSTLGLLRLGEIAEQFKGKVQGPKDLSSNIDKYLWD